MKDKHLFTSESVTEGHPDKICDQISDSILDAVYQEDPFGRVACETLITTGIVLIAGELTTSCYVDIPRIVRETIKKIGYDDPVYGFDHLSCGVLTAIQEQSKDIAVGVDSGGAGDQGMMFGYATDETDELMPLPITLAHALTRRLSDIRKAQLVDYLRPDGKSQVTVEYKDDSPERVDAIVLSAHHSPKVTIDRMRRDLTELVVEEVIPGRLIDKDTKILVNPTGSFKVGGPRADTGVTGRKIIVDTYGGVGSHGGGCFSGKDPTKVDRSGSYMARYIAKNIVAAKLASRCEVQLAYAIGCSEPVGVMVNTFDTGVISDKKLVGCVLDTFDLTPNGIIEDLDLRKPIYARTACYGHFGRNEKGFSWEKTDRTEKLKDEAGKE